MTMWLRSVGALAVCWLACTSVALAQERAPVEAFGRLPAVLDAAISPDGKMIALARSEGAISAVQIVDVDRSEIISTVGVEEGARLRGVEWADDRRVALEITRTFHPREVLPDYIRFRGLPRRVDYFRTGVFEVATERMTMLTTNPDAPWADQGSVLIAPIDGDPGYGRMIGLSRELDSRRPVIYRVDLHTGAARGVAVRGDNAQTLRYLLDRTGAVIARTDAEERSNRWRLFVYDGGTPRQLLDGVSQYGAPMRMYGLLADGRIATLDEEESGEFFALYAIDRQSGAREMIFSREGYEVDHVLTDPWTRDVVGVSWIESETMQHFFDEALQAAYTRVGAVFPQGSVRFISWSRDRQRILAYGERGLDGGAYYLFTPANNRLLRIGLPYPELNGVGLGERLAITYPARDGTRIPAYLTLPPGQADARNLPLVVLVHGGPASRDTFDFDYQAAFLASRGYAVLQANFRGSSGFGASWQRAGRRQWGGLMQTDVEDGVAALGRSGRIDPARVCIAGSSYGGYAALAGATLTPDRYRCAISISGVSDLAEMLRVERAETGRDSISSDYWRSIIGDGREDAAEIRAVSPAFQAERVRIPILLVHGVDDTVVRIDQSRRMERALRSAGKDVRFVELAGDDHYLSDAETRIQTLREMETFLAQHLPVQ